MTAEASECNGGGEAIEGLLAVTLGSGGDRERLDSAGGRISDGSSNGKDDPRPDHRDLESDPLGEGAGDAEGLTMTVVVDNGKEVRQEGNAAPREVGVGTNGESGTGNAKEGSGQQILDQGHIEENASVVATDGMMPENCVVAVETEMTGNDYGEMLEMKPWGHVEVVEVKASSDAPSEEFEFCSEDCKELERQNGHCNQLHEMNGYCNNLWSLKNGDASEVERDAGTELLSCENVQEQLEVATAARNLYEEEVGIIVELKHGHENEVTSIELDSVEESESSHVSGDKRDVPQTVRESQGHQVNMVSAVADEGSLEVCPGRQSESTHNAADMKSEIDQQTGPESESREECFEMRYLKGSEPFHNAADMKSEIDQQTGPESESREECFEMRYLKGSEPFHNAAGEMSRINQQLESESEEHQVRLVAVVDDEECLEMDQTIQPESSQDTREVKSEIDLQLESGYEEHQMNMISAVGDNGSQACEIVVNQAENQVELKSADEIEIDTAVIELDHQVEFESEREETVITATGDQIEQQGTVEEDVNQYVIISVTEFDHQVNSELEKEGQLNETVITVADDQIEQVVTIEDVNRNVDISITEFDGEVELELEREGQLTETVMTSHLESKQEPRAELVAEGDQVLPDQVVHHAEEKECLNFVRQDNDLKEIEPTAESELQQNHEILLVNSSNIAEVTLTTESEEKTKLENNLFDTATSVSACPQQTELRLGDMVHDVSSDKFNTGHMNVPDTNLEGHLEPNENHEMSPTTNGVTLVKDAGTDPGNSDMVHYSNIEVTGEVVTVTDVKQVVKDVSSEHDIHNQMSSPDLEGFSGKYTEPNHVEIDSSADASRKDGNEVESRYPESEQTCSQSSSSNVTQHYYRNQFIKFGEIVANLDETHIPRSGPFFIVRVPRFTGDQLWAKKQQAQDVVDEKTNIRDLINKEVQKQKAICLGVSGELAAAGFTELATREAFEAKRAELSYVASTVTMLSNTRSLEEIDAKIKEMEFNHQHMTVPLKEEKKYMQELKMLKRHREDISSFMGSKCEIDKPLKVDNSIDQKLKDLKKELDSLRSDFSQAEAKTIDARKKYDDEEKVLQDLRKKYDAANEIRQNAFSHLQHLKRESYEKSRHFRKYKMDQTTAKSYASSVDITGLWLHCSSQVEEFMDMWNNNDEFRKQYVDCNKNSVLRRFKTLDARSLGPDENPRFPSDMNKASSTNDASAKVFQPVIPLALEEKQETLGAKVLPPAAQTVQKVQPAKPRKFNAATLKATRDSSASLVPAMDVSETTENEKSMTKEEEELTRKAEELARKEDEKKKEKEAAELKERLKLEQKVKAKEAEERKKKQAERAQARAEYRAQKEAELKEKKKVKKEKRKGSAVGTLTDDKEVTVLATENNAAGTFQEQQPEAQATKSSKRSARFAVATKQYNRVQPIPLPLRNRGKRKIGAWMWAILIAVLVIVLFLAGNYISASTFSLQGFSF